MVSLIEPFQAMNVRSTDSDVDTSIFSQDITKNLNNDVVSEFLKDQWTQNFYCNIVPEPLYPADTVGKIGRKVIKAWVRMEIYFQNKMRGFAPCSSGNKIMLTGTKGVGKSTLMKGLYHIILKNCVHVIPIFNSFQEENGILGPSSFLDPPLAKFTTDNYESWARKQNKGIIYFGDEFDRLYNISKRDDAVAVAKEILSLGKSNIGFCCICLLYTSPSPRD